MIHDGRKVLDASLTSIRNAHVTRALVFEPLEANTDLAPLRALAGVTSVVRRGAAFDVMLAEGTDPAQTLRRRPTLEDVFVGIVTGGAGAAADSLRAALAAGSDVEAQGVRS
jgi:hypothetical protein